MNYDLVLVSTCIDDSCISTMINSVIDNNFEISVFILCLNQFDSDIEYKPNSKHTFVETIKVERGSLSSVRNIGLKHIKDLQLSFNHIMFPDDDSVYCNMFFSRYLSCVEKGKNYVIDVLNLESDGKYRTINLEDGQVVDISDYKYVMSVNMIVSHSDLLKVDGFDPNLGVGTKNGAAEDADFFVRISQFSSFEYSNKLFNYHPKNTDKFRTMTSFVIYQKLKTYSRGYMFFLKKHKRMNDFLLLMLRTMGTVVFYFFTLRWKMAFIYLKLFFFRMTLLSARFN